MKLPELQLSNQLFSTDEQSMSQPLVNCLEPLLKALHWPGKREHIIEALPYLSGIQSIEDFIQTMRSLHYNYFAINVNLKNLNPHLFPCLFISDNNKAYVVLDILENGQMKIYDAQKDEDLIFDRPDISGKAYLFTMISEKDVPAKSTEGWFSRLIKPRYTILTFGMFVGLVSSILALGIPIFMLVTYNQIIPSGSKPLLGSYLIGMLLLIIGIAFLEWLQNKLLIVVGTKITEQVNNQTFERILCLAPAYTEGASISAQVARFKDFGNVQEFLAGGGLRLFLNLPFIVVGILILTILAGWLVLVPFFSICIFLMIYTVIKNKVHTQVEFSAQMNNIRQDYILEVVHAIRTIKAYHGENHFYYRYLPFSAEAAIKNFNASFLHNTLSTSLNTLMTLSGFAILFFGALRVINNDMSSGALIASMMIVWRLLAPLKALFGSQTRVDRFASSIRQINSLMKIEPERDPKILVEKIPGIKGDVAFNRVGFRYPNAADFALRGISFSVKQGEVVGITGSTGSGKSTILKLVLGLYQPQTGNVLIDNQDIRQFDPIQLRYTLGYAAQINDIFFGTIAQNILIVKPTATEEELMHSIRRADLLDEIQAMPNGLNTFLDDQSHAHLAQGFLQRLVLARTYLKKPPIILFDEPTTTLDPKGEAALLAAIEYFRGHATIFLVTHRPSQLQIADKILLIRQGELLMSGPAVQTFLKLPKELL